MSCHKLLSMVFFFFAKELDDAATKEKLMDFKYFDDASENES